MDKSRPLMALVAVIALVAAACAGNATEGTSTTADNPTTTTTAAESPSGPATSPASIVFEDQDSDGTTIVVASITLPAPGFIAVHGNADGAPGAVVGHSALLPAGTSTDVVVTLDTPLTGTDLLFPMAHIDINENGEYEFNPPDEVIDGPAMTAEGDVAVVGAEVRIDETTGPALTVATSDLGDIIVDPEGNTLYLFIPDGQGESTCYDACEATWPPLTGDISVGEGLDASLLGSVTRADSSSQVTYNGWPLYHFVGDAAPGDTNGQGINDVWFVVGPDGEAVR